MKPGQVLVLAYLVASMMILPGVRAEELWWPQFRGPNASGTSSTAKPPTKFGPGDLEVWKAEVPWSPSSPAIWENQIFISTFDQGRLETRAYDRATGQLLWTRGEIPERLESFHRTDGSPAASTPATDGRRVVSCFGSIGVVCHDFDGKELWRLALPMAVSMGDYGSGSSPVIVGDRVFLGRDEEQGSRLLAVDLQTGRKIWEAPLAGPLGFGTPVHWKHEEADELVLGASLQVKGYDLTTGTERWRVGRVSGLVCPTPVVGDGMVYFGAWSPGKADSSFPLEWPAFASSFDKNDDGLVNAADHDPVTWEYLRGIDLNRDGRISVEDLDQLKSIGARAENVLLAIRPGGMGDITETHIAWRATRGLPYVPSPLYYDRRTYLVKDGGMMSSFDSVTGKAIYLQERLGAVGAYYASPVAADGRIYVVSVPGKLSVVKAGGEAPEVIHSVELGERVLATPALVGDRIYVRTQNHLYAFGPGDEH